MRSLPAGKHFLHAFPTFNSSGGPIRIANILNHLGPSVRHTIVSMDGSFLAQSRLDASVDRTLLPVETTGRDPLRNMMHLRSILHRRKPDLLLTYNWGSMDWSMVNFLWPVCPQIHFESGFGPEEAEAQLRRRVWTRRLVLRRVFRVAVPSHTLVDLATRVWRLNPERVLLIPNGVDIRRFAKAPGPGVVPGFVKAPDEIIVGTAAPLRAEKNLSRLIRAFAMLGPDLKARLVIAGDGEELEKLKKLVALLGIPERVVFAGHVERVEDLLGWFDVFAMSSDTEQMPNSLIQAMAAGLPVAATDVGDVKVILSGPNAPFVVSKQDDAALADALRKLIGSPDLRQSVSAANQERVRATYNKERMYSAYADLYATAIASRRR